MATNRRSRTESTAALIGTRRCARRLDQSVRLPFRVHHAASVPFATDQWPACSRRARNVGHETVEVWQRDDRGQALPHHERRPVGARRVAGSSHPYGTLSADCPPRTSEVWDPASRCSGSAARNGADDLGARSGPKPNLAQKSASRRTIRQNEVIVGADTLDITGAIE
jgi:hypothetical protein